MIVHNFDPVLVDLYFLQIRWYSLAYIFGIIFGWIYGKILIQNKYQKINDSSLITKKKFEDLILYLVVGIIIGGRAGYVLFYSPNYYSENFMEIFKIWKGGMSFHGGLVGIIICSLIFSKKNKISFFSITDVIACVSPIGIFFGRIANFINGELYGKISDLPWSVIFPKVDMMARHPSQIYEAILEGILLFIIINYFVTKKNILIKKGSASILFLIYYSIFRIFTEIFREPDVHLGYYYGFFSMGIILSFITLIFGIILYIILQKRNV